MNIIKLNRGGYCEEIDILKGYSILFVLFNHSTPLYLKNITGFDLWGGMGVPLFLLIQVFHYYKRGLDKTPAIKPMKVFQRVFVPFLIAETAIILLKWMMGEPVSESFMGCISNWGYGSGEYYIWIYLQFVLLLPLTTYILKKINVRWAPIAFIGISATLEIICSITNIAEHTYKFLFFRYFFLIYLGYLWAKNDIILNRKYLLLSIVSVIAILVFDLSGGLFEPFFYGSSWKCFHWISYFYPFALLPIILVGLHSRLHKSIRTVITLMGKYSWQIFCLQLVVFSFMSTQVFTFIGNESIRGVLYMIASILMSVIPVLLYKKYINITSK